MREERRNGYGARGAADRQGERDGPPAVIGHSFGGLLTLMIAGRGLAAVSVAISPAPFRGGLSIPIAALRSSWPVLRNPANRSRAIPLTFEQFRCAFANAVSEEEAKRLHETFSVPGSGAMIFQAATANLNPWTEAKVETKSPERGPLLIISQPIRITWCRGQSRTPPHDPFAPKGVAPSQQALTLGVFRQIR